MTQLSDSKLEKEHYCTNELNVFRYNIFKIDRLSLKFCECLSLFLPWLSRPTPLPSMLAPDFPPTPPCRAPGAPGAPGAPAPLPAALGWPWAKRQRWRKLRRSWISARCWRISLMQQMKRTNLNSGGKKKTPTKHGVEMG